MLNRKEILRQSIHLFFGILVIFTPESIDILTAGAFIFTLAIISHISGRIIEETSKKSENRLAKFTVEKAGKILGAAERDNTQLGKGATLFFVGAGLAMMIFPRDIALLSVMTLAVGDSLATMIGIHVGHHKIFKKSKKSWEGTLAGFAGILILGGFFFRPELVFTAALVSSITEVIFKKIDDNISIPLFTGAALFIVQQFLLI